MAKIFLLIFFVLSLSYSLPRVAQGIPEEELHALIWELRRKGYHLFPRAIMTSTDLRQQILAGPAFTLFAPTDAALFALEMTADDDVYIRTLHCHFAPSSLSYIFLRALPSGSFIPSLLPGRYLRVSPLGGDDWGVLAERPDFLTIDGVDVVLPGIFYSRNVAVHGLDGILSIRPLLDVNQDEDRSTSPSEFVPYSSEIDPDPSPISQDSLRSSAPGFSWSRSGVRVLQPPSSAPSFSSPNKSPGSLPLISAENETMEQNAANDGFYSEYSGMVPEAEIFPDEDLQYGEKPPGIRECETNWNTGLSHSGAYRGPRPSLLFIFT
ncbi:fasciclin-like arabinogalactan protein 19 [Aristolochia californica]|uniref:fasciclin-like arabinogalactan protein 19 n=1 Tax=Aristolochia californica TaxID=171875 RepID=UPI0035D94673